MTGTSQWKTFTQPIHIAQLNAQKKKDAVTKPLNHHVQDFDIIILQEPAWGFIGNDEGEEVRGPIALQGWNPVIPTTNNNNGLTSPQTLTYYRMRPDFSVTLRSDILEDWDIQVLDISQQGQPLTTLINVYNGPRLQQQSTLNRLRHAGLPRDHPVIITGDSNLHHDLWACRLVGSDEARTSGEIVGWLTEEGYTMLNQKGEITHPPHNAHERASVIDLTFVIGQAVREGTVDEWAIDPGLAHDSDHLGIKFIISHAQAEIDNPMDIKYCLKDVKPADWIKELESAIAKAHTTLQHLYTPRVLQPDILDQCAEALMSAMQTATAATAKIHKPCAFSKPWWDQDLAAAADRVSKAQKEQKRHHDTINTFSGDIRSRIRKARNYFKRLCWIKKRDWVNEKLQQATMDNIWGFQN